MFPVCQPIACWLRGDPTVMCHGITAQPRQERPLAEQHEEWMARLSRQVVSRRTIVRGAVGAAAGSLLLGAGNWSDQAVAAVIASTGTVAGGFLVNGRHLSFGDDPSRELDRVVFSRTAGEVLRRM
jgi:hypothetical protein